MASTPTPVEAIYPVGMRVRWDHVSLADVYEVQITEHAITYETVNAMPSPSTTRCYVQYVGRVTKVETPRRRRAFTRRSRYRTGNIVQMLHDECEPIFRNPQEIEDYLAP